MNKVIFRISEVAEQLGVSIKTVRRWSASGKIDCFRTIGRHRRFYTYEIKRVLDGKERQSKVEKPAIYARVSSHEQKQKGDLQRQIDGLVKHIKEKGLNDPLIFQDVGSGLNTKRKRFNKLCQAIQEGKVTNIYLTYPDRLTRFGFNYLENYFASYGCSITILEQKESRSLEDELVQDIIAIITSFSGRIHGLRSSNARKKAQELKRLKNSQLTKEKSVFVSHELKQQNAGKLTLC